MRPLQQLIYYTVLVMAGIVMFSILRETLSCKEKASQELAEPTAIQELSPTERPQSVVTSPEAKTLPSRKKENEPQKARFSRYQELKGKILLGTEESIERERLLSHRQTIDWIASTLTNPLLDINLKDRLSMVDYLEDAITWEENPIREDVVASIDGIIFSESYLRSDNEVKRQLIGDKIELFTILSQEFPEKAADVFAKVSGTKLESILRYASKRLPVSKPKSAE